jgi:hypothetical protein
VCLFWRFKKRSKIKTRIKTTYWSMSSSASTIGILDADLLAELSMITSGGRRKLTVSNSFK